MVEKSLCPNCGTVYFPDDQFCSNCGQTVIKPPTEEFKPTEAPPISKSRTEELKGHIQIIGTVEIVFGILGLIGGIFVGIVAIFVPLFIMEGDDSGASNQVYVAIFVGILLLAVTLLILAFAIASIVSGRRLMQYKNSGRTGTMIIGAISLINFPLGTIFGVVALYVLTRPEVEPLFS